MINKLIVLVAGLLGIGFAQVVPYGMGLEQGTQLIAFVAPNCTACEALAKIENVSITFVGREASLPYKPYRQDKNDLLAKTLRVQQAPTLVVLKDGWEVKRLTGKINPNPKTLNLLMDAADAGLLSPSYAMPLQLGETAPAPFQNYTGLLVFGREGCVWCEREKELLNALCQKGQAVTVVYSEGKWPEACKGEINEKLFSSFGIPGTPTHVYLAKGKVVWIGVGYYSDLTEVMQALVAMEAK